MAPDVLVCFGVDRCAWQKADSYRVFDAAPPAFVLEVASKRTRRRDRRVKPAIYWEMGVGEDRRFDPTGGRLPLENNNRRLSREGTA